ncbi:MAG: M16 family metallopeptidase [Pyrinomonadaceae bacterium]
MSIKEILITALVVVSFVTSNATAQPKAAGDRLPALAVKEYRLKNGLRVILHPDRSTPIVAVNVWYHVGSKNEVPGRTGFAHLFEHMMFQGSKNYDTDFLKAVDDLGASNLNGSTNADRTNYYEVVPSNQLEAVLFLEADRMGGLLDALTQEKLDNQRDVVKNERRQNYDNQPYGTASEKIAALMYPSGHPYSWTTIGSLDDLTAASMEDVKSFFRQFYVPNNASLVIAGDFDEKQARRWVEKYFGPIRSGSNVVRPNPAAPKLDGVIRREYEDAVQLPRLYQVWHTVPMGHRDEAALDILASILSAGRGSRLQSKMVFDKQLVQDVFASHFSREIGGSFQITSTARPGKTLNEVEQEIDAEIERIKKEAPSADEVQRALNRIEAQAIFSLQTVNGKADQLNRNATFFDRPDSFQQQLDEYRRVTPADVQRVAREYLVDNHLVMNFVPRKQRAASAANTAANTPTTKAGAKREDKPDYSKNLPKPGPEPKFSLPAIEKQKLSNGLEVWLVRQTELPIVSMNLVLKTGATADPNGKAGTASFTSSLLNTGTKTRSAVDIANQLADIGASLNTGSGWDASNVSMQTLTKNLDKALDVFADVVVNASFPEKEFETLQRRSLIGFQQRRDNANAIAGVAYSKLLYGKDHPYGNAIGGDEASVKSLKRSDVQGFYERFYRPNNAVLIVAGNTTMQDLTPRLEKAFAGWKPAEVASVTIADPPSFDRPGIYLIDKPGAAQSVVLIGHVGVPRNNPDYYALEVMNNILGGGGSARLFMNLREDKGYTYGAYSNFSFRRGAGPFTASAGVQTAVTKESVIEFMKELNGIRGSIPITPQEFEANKRNIIRSFPAGFETNGQIAGQLANIVTFGLPDTYFNDYIRNINAVTLVDVNRVANKYLTPDKMAVLIVGDRSVVESRLREIDPLGRTIYYLDADGNPIAQ